MKILVVDDDESGRVLLQKLLKQCSYEVVTATNGSEGLEKALEQSPDLIISDVMMPVMDGFIFCKKCQEHNELKDIPFLIYSAIAITEEDEKRAIKLGAKAFIIKPTASDVLTQIIKGQFLPLDTDQLIELLKNEQKKNNREALG